MAAAIPRVVVVTRQTEYAALLGRHGTREQARFFLATRGRAIEELEAADAVVRSAVAAVGAAVPTEWRRVKVDRGDLDRFLFEPEDLVVAVGQDGLVANVAKYLAGQLVIGCNPDPARYEGVLVAHAAAEMKVLVPAAVAREVPVAERSMVEAVLDDGLRLLALNEVFVGHQSHQSSRYSLAARAGPNARVLPVSSSRPAPAPRVGAARLPWSATPACRCPGPGSGHSPSSCARPGRPSPPARR